MALGALTVKNLSFHYCAGLPVLQNINFGIQPGERVALVGANGSGKSTLQRHLNGLLRPQSGQIYVDDCPVIPAHFPQIRQWIGLVFQNPDDQLFMPTVAEDVAFGLAALGWDNIPQKVEQALQAVNLNPQIYGPRYPAHLSGGEKKRAAIAGILALQPRILVLDEPSGQLDPRSRRQLIALLSTLSGTQLIATHDLDLAWELCERTLLLHQGQLVYDGPTTALLANVALLHAYELEPPLSFRRPYCALGDRPDQS